MTGTSLSQSRLNYAFDYEGSRQLSLCGFIPNFIEDFGPRYVVKRSKSLNGRYVWQETETCMVLCAGLSLNDPNSQTFVNGCLRHPDFMVIVRKGAKGRIIKSVDKLWACRTREAPTRAGLKNVPWESAGKITYFNDSILEETWPSVSFTEKIEDCFQIVILDAAEGETEDLVRKVRNVWYQIYGVDSVEGLYGAVGGPYVERDELELRRSQLRKGQNPFVPNVEPNILTAYKHLWGVKPMGGYLVDD